MRRRAYWLVSLLLAACAVAGPPGHASLPPATFIVVRHAEKAVDGSTDPPLAAVGVGRARALARSLADTALVAVYSTPFRRTRETARPTAVLHGVPVATYDPAMPPPAFAAQLRASHPSGTVLVVGHSNTVPAIASALCDCRAAPLGENDYDAIYTVRMQRDGTGVLEPGRQSPP
jgi:broad specificity phosphatase PhoE